MYLSVILFLLYSRVYNSILSSFNPSLLNGFITKSIPLLLSIFSIPKKHFEYNLHSFIHLRPNTILTPLIDYLINDVIQTIKGMHFDAPQMQTSTAKGKFQRHQYPKLAPSLFFIFSFSAYIYLHLPFSSRMYLIIQLKKQTTKKQNKQKHFSS